MLKLQHVGYTELNKALKFVSPVLTFTMATGKCKIIVVAHSFLLNSNGLKNLQTPDLSSRPHN